MQFRFNSKSLKKFILLWEVTVSDHIYIFIAQYLSPFLHNTKKLAKGKLLYNRAAPEQYRIERNSLFFH